MRRARSLFAALAITTAWSLACTGGDDAADVEVSAPAPEVVAAHTRGTISAEGPVRVQLTSAVQGVSAGDDAPDVFRFTPSVDGTTRWASPRELVFEPTTGFPSGAEVTATVALSKVLSDASDFGFTFDILQQAMWTEAKGLSAEDETGATQRYEGAVLTADRADPGAVEASLTATFDGAPVDISWSHSADGRDHGFVINGLARADDAARTLVLKLSGEPLSLDTSLEETVSVPALSQFTVTEAKAVTEGDRYIELRFTDPVAEQSLDGLITVGGRRDLRFVTDGSVVRVYSASGWSGSQTVSVRGIKNAAGRTLSADASHTVSFEPIKPGVKFAGTGVILPTTQQLTLPVEVANLSALTITARQIFDDNIPQFLQVNELDGDRDLERVGRPVWRKRVPLKTTASGGNRWARVGLDLTELVEQHPGGMYRLELSFGRNDIVWDCPTPGPDPVPLPALGDDDWERGGSGESSYWDAWDDGLESWEQYRNREDPCTRGYYRSYYDHDIRAGRNVLVSDLGLMAKLGEDGRLVTFATDLLTAQPEQGVQVEVLDYQQQVLASATTSADGSAAFAALDRKPFVVHASDGDHHAWVKLARGAGNTLSHFDVGGTTVAEGLKGAFFAERGVWRPGDDIHLHFVLLDTTGELPDDHPLLFELVGPTGNRVNSRVVRDHTDRFYVLTTGTDADAPTGNYTARVRVGGRVFERTLRVETIVPNRLKIDLDYGTDRIEAPDLKLAGTLSSRWLHGAKAPGLRAAVQMKLSPIPTRFAGFDDFVFDDPASQFSAEQVDLFEGTLDEQGKVAIDERLFVPDGAPGMLKATFTTRVFEPSGAASVDQGSVEVSPHERYIGLKTPKGDAARGMLLTDVDHPIEIVAVDGDGQLAGDGEVELSLYKVRWRWWWESGADDLAEYVGSDSVTPIKKEIVRLKGGKATWNVRIDYPAWGRYLLVAEDRQGGHTTGKTVYIDWPGWAGRGQKDNPGGASVLSVTTADKKVDVGQQVTLNIPTPAGGRALVSLESGTSVLKTEWVEPTGDTTTYTFTATPSMAPSVYAHVTLVQPHTGANDLPLRLYGVVPVEVVDPDTRLEPTISTADVLEPESTATVRVAEASGQPMTYTLAVVDEGLLGLTRFQTPDLWSTFYQREALGVRTWDTFSLVAGGLAGSLEELLRIGGDGEADGAPPAKANRFPPVVRVLGPFRLDAGAEASHEVQLPPYIGEVRVMVVAGRDGAFGKASKQVPVRKPLMLLASLPRVLGSDESLELPVSVFAMEDSVRDVTVSVKAEGPVSLDQTTAKLRFSEPGDQMVTFPVNVDEAVGIARFTVVAEGGGERSEQLIEIDVRHPNPPEERAITHELPASDTWLAAVDLFGVSGSNEAVLEVSRTPPLDLERRLGELVRYPHGCVEQTTSGAFPQVYLTSLVDLDDARRREVQRNVEAGIDRLRSFQQGGGGFGYWPGAHDTHSWATTYVGHFLLEAERAGYLVPADMKQAWVAHQTKVANRFTGQAERSDLQQAYRLYTLALAGKPALGAMNRLKESPTLSNDAKLRLAGAYHLAGQPQVATTLLAGVPLRFDTPRELSGTYGSQLRDRALALEVLSLIEPDSERTATVASEVSDELVAERWLSTQEAAFALVAMARFADAGSGDPLELSWRLGDAPAVSMRSVKPVAQVALPVTDGAPQLQVTSTSGQRLYLRLITRGLTRIGGEIARSEGLSVSVQYVQPDPYKVLSVDELDQGVDFVARVTVKNNRGRRLDELALTQIVPSGWEIHGTAPGPGDGYEYRDVRDDRVLTYFDLDKGEERTFTVGLNASFKGRYYLPAVDVRAMYDESIVGRTSGQWVTVREPGPRG
jgi:uncharacterized protein YfaS (alpha-2-macroglobulin family)